MRVCFLADPFRAFIDENVYVYSIEAVPMEIYFKELSFSIFHDRIPLEPVSHNDILLQNVKLDPNMLPF